MSKFTIKTDLTVKQSSSGYGFVTHFEEPKVFNSIEEAEELNYYDVKGALLSYKDGKYTAWNGEEDLDSRAWDYREDRSSYAAGIETYSSNIYATGWNEDVDFPDDYGDVIAVCVGNGLWMSIKWDSNNNNFGYHWCIDENSPLYDVQPDCIQGTGWENTSKLVSRCRVGDLFAYVRDFGADDGTQGHWYVPSKFEIFQTFCNSGDISTDSNSYSFLNNISNTVHMTSTHSRRWTSSQNSGNIRGADWLIDGYSLGNAPKSSPFTSTILLRFGEKLYE